MKKIFGIFVAFISVFLLASCGATQLQAPTLTLAENVVSWSEVANAKGYVVSKNDTALPEQTATSYTISDTEVGNYVIKVKAISSDTTKYTDSAYSTAVTYTVAELEATTLYVVGDSTVCSFNDNYFYPRYGYGTQLSNYLDEKVTVNNLAISGRSSLSFLTEANYETLKTSIKKGDYLMIGFGHNDEKSDDPARYTLPTLNAHTTEKTNGTYNFQYILNEKYIKLATEKGATPILCTPIVRLDTSDNYSGASGHVTDAGDYAECIVNLGTNTNTKVINLRDITKAKYTSLGNAEAKYYHAVTSGSSDTEANFASIDKTHINIYGAKYVAYEIAKALGNDGLGKYVKANITEPTKATDLVKNPNYKYVAYTVVDWSAYQPCEYMTTITEGWYGTAFGDCGGTPDAVKEDGSSTNGYYAQETSAGVFKVGQHLDSGSAKGKFAAGSEGFAFLFKQVSINDNFTITAEAKVLTSANTKQAGFGLMLRDDCYLPIKDSSIVGNYVAAGILTNESDQVAIFSRSEASKNTKSNNTISGLYAANDTASLSIERVGQAVTVKVTYKGTTYTEVFTDFDFVAKDTNYMYVGMFANRGTTVEFTNVVYTKTGTSQGA